MIQLGLRLHDAEKVPMEQMLPLVRAKGFTCAHLALSKAMKEYSCAPGALTPGYALYLRHLFEKNGIDIAVLGNYLNLLHPDADALKANMEKYFAHIRFAALLGCGMVGTETGAPNAQYKFCPECRDEKTLLRLVENLKPVVRCAEQFGVILAIEPVAKHTVWGPKACRKVLDEIGSYNLQVLFDPVNMLDEENVDHREEIFQEAMELLGKDICMLHLKDFVRSDSGLISVGAGTGEMDYSAIMSWVKKEKPFLFATLENTTPENAESCRIKMQTAYDLA